MKYIIAIAALATTAAALDPFGCHGCGCAEPECEKA